MEHAHERLRHALAAADVDRAAVEARRWKSEQTGEASIEERGIPDGDAELPDRPQLEQSPSRS